MGISEETEVELTDEEEDEIVASILDTIPDAEAAPDEYEDDINFLDAEDFQDDGISEETEKLDARRRQFREKIKQLAYTKAKQMIKGIVDADDEEVEGINSSLEVQKDEATGAVFVSHVKEEIEESTELGEAKRGK
jgi:type II secretory pathway component HofQ